MERCLLLVVDYLYLCLSFCNTRWYSMRCLMRWLSELWGYWMIPRWNHRSKLSNMIFVYGTRISSSHRNWGLRFWFCCGTMWWRSGSRFVVWWVVMAMWIFVVCVRGYSRLYREWHTIFIFLLSSPGRLPLFKSKKYSHSSLSPCPPPNPPVKPAEAN